MANELIKIFEFHGNTIRTRIINGEVWFCLKDLCEALDISHTTTVARDLDDDEKIVVYSPDGNRGNPNLIFVSEAGFYAVIRKSRKPEAKAIDKWVRHDVLPSIRKNGGYVTDQTKADPKRFLQSLPPDDMWAAIRSMVEDRTIAAEHMASLERQKRLESEESRRAADARTKGAIDDNAKLIHENRQLERAFDTARRETDSLARHGWKTKKVLDELAEQLGIESKDLLAQHDAEERVEKPSQGLSRGRSTHQQWVNNFYAPPPKKDDE
jgi:prophage antirepressor-like protein